MKLHSILRADAIANGAPHSAAGLLLSCIFHPSVRACFLIRVATLYGRTLYWVCRNLLIALHAIDVAHGARIGPGLRLPHPIGIIIGRGTSIGANVTVFQHVTIGHSKGGYPRVQDGVVIYPGAIVVGPISIGIDCRIGAGIFLDQDVPPKTTVRQGARETRN